MRIGRFRTRTSESPVRKTEPDPPPFRGEPLRSPFPATEFPTVSSSSAVQINLKCGYSGCLPCDLFVSFISGVICCGDIGVAVLGVLLIGVRRLWSLLWLGLKSELFDVSDEVEVWHVCLRGAMEDLEKINGC